MLRLILMRHAKAAPQAGGGDHERPLAKRGLADAPRMGNYLLDNLIIPDLAVASDARRTRETMNLVTQRFSEPVKIFIDPALYLAEAPILMAEMHKTPKTIKTLLAVAHNPGLMELAMQLTGFGDRYAFSRMSAQFPTCGMAILDFDVGNWAQVMPKTGRLDRFITPAMLEGGVDEND